jgi:hypothetical protein
MSKSPTVSRPAEETGQMTHREIMEALTGLLLAMFVAMVSSTIVSNALPVIVTDLKGSQTGYTWVVVATLLTMTATTPIWGKLADLFPQKILVQIALVIFSLGSIAAGLAPSMEVLIGARAFQGLGVGGLTALVQVVIASMVPPARTGPLFGLYRCGLRARHRVRPAHRRPARRHARLALVLLCRAPHRRARVRRAPKDPPPHPPQARGAHRLPRSHAVDGWSLDAADLGLPGRQPIRLAEQQVVRPDRRRGGVHLRGGLRRDEGRDRADHPDAALPRPYDLPGHGGFGADRRRDVRRDGLSESVLPDRARHVAHQGRLDVDLHGRRAPRVVDRDRSDHQHHRAVEALPDRRHGAGDRRDGAAVDDRREDLLVRRVGAYMAVLGLGLGATMQNLVLAVQNNTAQADMGAASSVVAFFRSLGGSAGVSALGAVLSHQVASTVTEGLAKMGIKADSHESHSIPDVSELPAPIRALFEHAFGSATGHLFLVATPFAIAALVCLSFIKEVPLRTTVLRSDELAPEVAAELGVDQPHGVAR